VVPLREIRSLVVLEVYSQNARGGPAASRRHLALQPDEPHPRYRCATARRHRLGPQGGGRGCFSEPAIRTAAAGSPRGRMRRNPPGAPRIRGEICSTSRALSSRDIAKKMRLSCSLSGSFRPPAASSPSWRNGGAGRENSCWRGVGAHSWVFDLFPMVRRPWWGGRGQLLRSVPTIRGWRGGPISADPEGFGGNSGDPGSPETHMNCRRGENALGAR